MFTSQALIRLIAPVELAALVEAYRAALPEGEALILEDYRGVPIVRGLGPTAVDAVLELADRDTALLESSRTIAPDPPPPPPPPPPPV